MTTTSSSVPVVVVGACGHGLAVSHGLARGGVRPIVLESNLALPGARARHGRLVAVPDLTGQHLVEALITLAERERFATPAVLLLTNDRMVATVCQQWPQLAAHYRLSFAGAREQVLKFLTKSALEARCREVGLRYPRTFLMQSPDDARAAVAEIGFPMIVKPARPLASFKTARPADQAALESLAAGHAGSFPFLVQQFVDGPESATQFCALYLGPQGEVARFTGRKLRSRPLGHTTVAESFDSDIVWRAARRFFDGTGITGPVSLEVKIDAAGEPWVIEPTVGRTDFWVGLCVANGVNLPLIEYRDQAGLDMPTTQQCDDAVWFNEERDPYGRGWFTLRSGHRLDRRHAVYLYLNDEHGAVRRQALRQILATVWRDARSWSGKRLGRVFGRGSDTAAGASPAAARLACYDSVDALPPEVLTLLTQAERRDLQSGADWYRNLTRTVPALGQSAQWHVLSQDGVPRVVLPVVVRRTGAVQGSQVASLANYYTALYAPLLGPGVRVDEVAQLLHAVAERNAPVSCMQFAPMDPGDPGFRLLRAGLGAAGLRVLPYFCFGNWHLPVTTTWPEYLASRGGELRNTLQRMRKRFDRLGGQLSIVQAGPEVEQATAAYLRVYARSWKRPEPYPDFIPGLIATCVQRGWLRLGLATIDGEPVAAQLWIVAHRRAHIFKLAHDERHKHCSPGSLLTAHLMRHVIEVDQVLDIDYMTGDDAYKAKWMSLRHERLGLAAYNLRHPAGLAGYARDRLGRSVRHWRHPTA